MKLVVATRNTHKLAEIRAILGVPGLELLDLTAFPHAPEVEEDGETFVSNAVKKAMTIALSTREWALADDSGLEVDFLHGEPGVHSARYAGEPVSYEANNRKLLKAMEKARSRTARFRCVIALASPGGRAQVVEGRCEGRIVEAERGAHGFGYDPLFVPDGYEQTFAEMPDTVKNGISHRANALKAAVEMWGPSLREGRSPWR